MFLLKKFAAFSTKKVSQFANEVHEIFSKTSFCNQFVNSTSLDVNEKSFIFLSAHRPIIFVSVYHARFELANEAIVKTRWLRKFGSLISKHTKHKHVCLDVFFT